MSLSRLLSVIVLCTIAAPAFGQSVNDDCSMAIAVAEGTVSFDNTNDTTGSVACNVNFTNDVWYLYTASADGDAVISTCNSTGTLGDTIIAVYDATPGCPTPADIALACVDDACGVLSEAIIPVVTGQQLYVQVGGWGGGTGTADLSILINETDCFDGIDNNLDGLIDCDDPTCATVAGCIEVTCDDGIDEDLDGLTDCEDPDCAGDASCDESLNCGDGLDNDLDGLIDCNDTDCLNVGPCSEALNCADGIDNDSDGDIDCVDADCLLDPACVVITNDNCIDATIVGLGDTQFNNIPATLTGPTDCDANMSTDVWFEFTAPADGLYEVSTCNTIGTLTDTTLIVYDGTAGCPMAPDPGLACDDDSCGPTDFNSLVQVPLTMNQVLLIQVGGWNGTTGEGTLTITQGELNCADGIDDDADGLIDCADPDCTPDPACFLNNDCVGAISVGLGDTTFDNSGATLTGPIDCDGNMSGDVWFEFTAPAAGTYNIGTCNTVGSLTDTTLIVYDGAACPVAPDPGLACDDDSCGPTGFNSAVSLTLAMNESVLIQVGGWNGTTGDATLTIAEEVSQVTNVVCTDNGASIDVTWDDAVGGPGVDSYNIYVDGLLVGNQLVGMTSFNTAYPAGGVGIVEVCIETVFGADLAGQVCCSISIGGPANDECIDAVVIGLGDTTFDNTAANSPANQPCGLIGADVWFEYTATFDGFLTVETCNSVGTLGDSVLAIYDGGAGCPAPADAPIVCNDDGGCGLLSLLTIPVTNGAVFYIQAGGFNGATGDATVTLTEVCGDLGAATCDYDSGTDTLTISWTDNPNATLGYDIFENGVMVGTAPAGTPAFQIVAPPLGQNTYDITWTCSLTGAAGDGATCDAVIFAAIPAGTTDLILALEGLDDAGALGDIDSSAALSAALTTAGQTVHIASLNDFDLSGLDFSIPDRIWVMTGTFPNDTRLTLGELDLLASLAATGTGIYLEGADHWGFLHVASNLDARDGIEEDVGANIDDGDDSFTAMDGADAPAAGINLSGLVAVPYTQDQGAADDFTDILSLTGTDPLAVGDPDVASAEALFTNSPDGLPAPPLANDPIPYITTVVAVHNDGGVMISSSWEFGGFGGDQNALAAEYLAAFGGVMPPGQFNRGDTNNDGGVNIADAIFLLGVLFPGPSGPNLLACDAAADTNNDSSLNIADAIFLLGVLFPGPSGPNILAPPAGGCGSPAAPPMLTCDASSCP